VLRNVHHPERGRHGERTCERCGGSFVPPEHRPGARICEKCYTKATSNSTICIVIPPRVRAGIDHLIDIGLYISVADVARDGVRRLVLEMLRQERDGVLELTSGGNGE